MRSSNFERLMGAITDPHLRGQQTKRVLSCMSRFFFVHPKYHFKQIITLLEAEHRTQWTLSEAKNARSRDMITPAMIL
jgi:hypothetical protein